MSLYPSMYFVLPSLQEILEKTQGSSKQVEENFKEEYTALEKKYQKAKKLIKEYQQR